MKTTCRNAVLEYESDTNFGRFISYFYVAINFWDFGLGFSYHTGDSLRFFDLHFLFFYLQIWF